MREFFFFFCKYKHWEKLLTIDIFLETAVFKKFLYFSIKMLRTDFLCHIHCVLLLFFLSPKYSSIVWELQFDVSCKWWFIYLSMISIQNFLDLICLTVQLIVSLFGGFFITCCISLFLLVSHNQIVTDKIIKLSSIKMLIERS